MLLMDESVLLAANSAVISRSEASEEALVLLDNLGFSVEDEKSLK